MWSEDVCNKFTVFSGCRLFSHHLLGGVLILVSAPVESASAYDKLPR
jgi:hypothetical protein